MRQGAIRRGAKVSFINPRAYDVRFPVTADLASNGLGMAQHLAAVLAASLKAQGKAVPSNVAAALEGVTQHLRRFWEPRMRRELLAWFDEQAGAGLRPLVLESIRTHRGDLLAPAPTV